MLCHELHPRRAVLARPIDFARYLTSKGCAGTRPRPRRGACGGGGSSPARSPRTSAPSTSPATATPARRRPRGPHAGSAGAGRHQRARGRALDGRRDRGRALGARHEPGRDLVGTAHPVTAVDPSPRRSLRRGPAVPRSSSRSTTTCAARRALRCSRASRSTRRPATSARASTTRPRTTTRGSRARSRRGLRLIYGWGVDPDTEAPRARRGADHPAPRARSRRPRRRGDRVERRSCREGRRPSASTRGRCRGVSRDGAPDLALGWSYFRRS